MLSDYIHSYYDYTQLPPLLNVGLFRLSFHPEDIGDKFFRNVHYQYIKAYVLRQISQFCAIARRSVGGGAGQVRGGSTWGGGSFLKIKQVPRATANCTVSLPEGVGGWGGACS
jgi:hypothetical protein